MIAEDEQLVLCSESTGSKLARCKARDLFRNRLVFWLARRHLDQDAYRAWQFHALALQRSIYRLDQYYEGSEQIKQCHTEPFWQDVRGRLPSAAQQASSLAWEGFDQLRQYALVEDRIHVFDRIDPREFQRIVLLKSSDVRMARALIWTYTNYRIGSASMLYWQCFDQCRELIEDMQDVAEDGKDWNFNFWLYPYMAGMSIERGIAATSAVLVRKMRALDTRFSRLGGAEQQVCRRAHDNTMRLGQHVLSHRWLLLKRLIHCRVYTFKDMRTCG